MLLNFLKIFFLFAVPSFAFAQTVTLEVRAFAQGFYSHTTSSMIAVVDPINHPNLCDTATIVLIDSSSGHGIYCERTVFSTQGYGYTTLPSQYFNNSYLIGVHFRNTLNIVSLNNILLDSANKSVDLTIPAHVCCSYDSTYGVATAYSGDVDRNGSIDNYDMLLIYNDNLIFASGYLATDLNGDASVDAMDITLIYNNKSLFLFDNFPFVCMQTGVKENNSFSAEINTFPNPFTEKFNLSLPETHQNIKLVLTDIAGKIHYSNSYQSRQRLVIETGILDPGIYFLRVIADEKEAIVKLISF